MSQDDFDIADGSGSTVLADMNSQIEALVTNSSGLTEPGTMYQFQDWIDTTTNTWKRRNSANSAWVTMPIDLAGAFAPSGGTAGAPGYSISGDSDTGMYSDTADELKFSIGATETLRLDSTGIVAEAIVLLQAGTVAAPALVFEADTNTGIYGGADAINIATGGVKAFGLDSSGNATVTGTVTAGSSAVALTAAGGSLLLAALEAGGASSGDVVTFNGSNWAAAAPPAGGNVDTLGLTTGTIPKASSTTDLEDSLLTESSSKIGINQAAPDGTLHIHTATAGLVSSHANASDLVIENSGNCGISILTPDASVSSMYFGSPTGSTAARITWDHTTLIQQFGTFIAGGAIRFISGNGGTAMDIDTNQDVTVPNGHLTLTTGNETITAGDLTVTAGDVEISAGSIGIGAAANANSVRVIHTDGAAFAGAFNKNVSGSTVGVFSVTQDHASGQVPALEIQQDDVSEGCINFVASDRGAVTTSTVDSVASARVEINGTVYVIALHADQ